MRISHSKGWAALAIIAQLNVAIASSTPPESFARVKLGIVRVGAATPQTEALYPIVERRVQAWLENLDQLKTTVVRLPSPRLEVGEGGQLQSEQNEFSELKERFEREGNTDAVEADLQRLEQRIPHYREKLEVHGPLLQRLMLLRAAFDFNAGREFSVVQRQLNNALLVHPSLENFWTPMWKESEESRSPVLFDDLIERERKKISRDCVVRVKRMPLNAAVSLNGFPLKERSVRLNSGASYEVLLQGEGYREQRKTLRCGKAKVLEIAAELQRSDKITWTESWEKTLTHLARRHDREALLIVTSQEERLKLFYFTPGASVEEVPLNNPPRLAELADTEAALPIATDAFVGIVQRQRVASLSLGEPLREGDRAGLTDKLPYQRRWYNDWKFWAVVGSVAAISLVAYASSRGNSQVGTQKVDGVVIRFE